MEWGLRGPITPRLGWNGWGSTALGKIRAKEEKHPEI
jgi:hypothetical protein